MFIRLSRGSSTIVALCLLTLPVVTLADAVIAGPLAPGAVTTVADSYTLHQLIEQARRNNRDLQAARFAVDVARTRLTQAGARPNPHLELGARSDFLFRNEGEYGTSIGISQQFPVTDRISRQQDVAQADIAVAQAEVADAERRLAGEIAADVYHLLVLDRQIQSKADLITLEDKLARTTRARYKAAEVSELDVNAVQLGQQQLEQERRLLQSQRQTLLTGLNTRLGRPAGATLSIAEPLPETEALPPLEQLQTKGLSAREDLHSAQLDSDRARAAKALAMSQRWEDWNAGVAVTQDQAVIDGAPSQPNSHAIQVSVSIPLPLFNKNQGQIAEAEASGDQARAHADALRLAIAGEISSAWDEASSIQQQLGQYRQSLFPVSARSVQLAQKGYADGLASILEVLQAQRQQADLNAAYLNTLDQFLQALVRLHTAVGDYISAPANPDTDHKDS